LLRRGRYTGGVAGLPPTSPSVADATQKPYFLWWADISGAEFRQKLAQGSLEERAYWLGALLREANTRDVWLFTSVRQIVDLWPHVYKHLGRSKRMWSFLLQLAPPKSRAHDA
jgi:hypothetical protein